jgi:5-methylcytosine-specific restriction endonuclease McrA
MSGQWISAAIRERVAQRARYCCEYCRIPEDAVFAPHEPDHVIAEQHGGQTTPENLALACWRCNRRKGTNLATLDPQTGKPEFLFNPRQDRWEDHFIVEGARISGVSPVGRATAALLRFNSADRLELRERLITAGKFF